MKIIIAGGTGHLGRGLTGAWRAAGHQVVVLTRQAAPGPASGDATDTIVWDGRTLGPWAHAVDGADVVVNLAGRSVDCRYTRKNRQAILSSRVESTRVIGQAIAAARRPPRVWLQMSTATIYDHTFDRPNDEATGAIGGHTPGAPATWQFSVDVARAWEREQELAKTPRTRRVALRAAMVMDAGGPGVFRTLSRLTRWRLGGAIAGGRQYMSWIHSRDFRHAVDFLIARDDIAGAVNLAAPTPLPQAVFMDALATAWGRRPNGLPVTRAMASLGAFALRTETELILKSRRVVPGRLLAAGFWFEFPTWPDAATDLVRQARAAATEKSWPARNQRRSPLY